MTRTLSLALAAACAGPLFGQSPPPQAPLKAPPTIPTDLTDYVSKPDAAFAWKLADKADTPAGAVYLLKLTSQAWHGTTWDHDLQIVVPKDVKPRATVLLWNQGGTAGVASTLLAQQLAAKVKAPVAFLYGVPKQPLFDGQKEDALIAETFVKYIDTGDPTWPLLFPMVKSVVRAMDAVQAFAKQEWQHDVTHFVVTGASKRGWTTWLTAATGDPRVKAIAPLVFDTLNLPEQMKNQVAAFGRPSDMIADYTKRGLVPIPDTDRARKLWAMVDPWVYRAKLTLPKLIVNGTNDRYWPADAVTSYWADLPGEKYLLAVPNAGHDLREVSPDGQKQVIPDRAVNTLAAFAHAQIFGKKLPSCPPPKVGPTAGGGVYLNMDSCGEAAVTLWTADAPGRDFRAARWAGNPPVSRADTVPAPRDGRGGSFVSRELVVPAAASGNRMAFVEHGFKLGDMSYTLSSPMVRVPAAPPKP